MLSLLMLDEDWNSANAFYKKTSSSDPYFNELGVLLLEREKLQKKSPYLAAGMSTIIPGSGKIYTKNWQDGLVALLFVASNAWQAYRGFSKDGIKSTYGWVFGSIGAGFWLGNIYGSYKSAKKFNNHIQKGYHDKISGVIYDRM